MKICNVEQMRKIDGRAEERFGIKGEKSMENAGQGALRAIKREYSVEGNHFILFCGPGNNGGDGLVLARKLLSENGSVEVVLMERAEKFGEAPRRNLEIVKKLSVELSRYSEKDFSGILSEADFVVDALFGTGLTRPVKGSYREAVELINESEKKVISLDISSGVEGNGGTVMGASVDSDMTVTFGLPKLGNLLYPGFSRCGKLYLSRISFPPSLTDPDFVEARTNDPAKLPRRNPEAHKGSFGRALFIGGADNYYWAPYASARSFLKAGGGYAYLACPRSIAGSLGQKDCQAVILPLPEAEEGRIGKGAGDALFSEYETELKKAELAVLGPGISRGRESQKFVREAVKKLDEPLVLDGDGLNALAGYDELISSRENPTVLTPHLGEMSELVGEKIETIKRNGVEVLKKASSELDSIVVLKGAHSLIGYPHGRVYLNPTGNSGMATAGSGDVLTGTIAALLGLGTGVEKATRLGVYIHGLAGDRAAKKVGKDGMTAQEVLDFLPEAVKKYREDRVELSEDFYGKLETL